MIIKRDLAEIETGENERLAAEVNHRSKKTTRKKHKAR